MKKILPIILFVFIFLLSLFVRAGDSNGVESNRNCIDLKAVYEEANATSQAITGKMLRCYEESREYSEFNKYFIVISR